MANNLSGKVKKTPPTGVSADRYNYIGLSETEPDLGVPSTSDQVLTSSVQGVRSWSPASLLQGTQGTQGIQGRQGTQGIQGRQGTNGTQGIQGITGNTGDIGGVPYTFSTTITDDNPGLAVIRYNNATISSVNQIFIHNLNANSVGMQNWYNTWDDSTSTVKGYLTILNRASNTGNVITNVWAVTGSVVGAGVYSKIPVSYIEGSLPIDSATLSVSFSRTGDIGTQGITGNQGTTGIQGNQGTQGIQGIQGLDGAFAAQGIQGPQGIQGNQGTQGIEGIQGNQGTQGIQGNQGTQGIQGNQGTQGIQGQTGNGLITGLQGIGTTTYTLQATDVNKFITLNNSSSITLTIPPSVFIENDQIHVQQIGTGQTTFAAGSGVTITSAAAVVAAPKLRAQYSGASIICLVGGATPSFTVLGDIS